MRHRPWPIVILAFLQIFVEPITNVLLGAWLSKYPVGAYLRTLFREGHYLGLAFMFLLPMARGFAVYSMRKWSYPVFFGLCAWSLGQNFHTWWTNHDAFPLMLFLPLWIGNVAFVGYFLIPAVKAAYTDPKLRWWQSKPRYSVDIPATIRVKGETIQGTIMDLSDGGVFLVADNELPEDGKARLHFRFLNLKLKPEFRIVHHRRLPTAELGVGHGIEFVRMTRGERASLRLITRTLSRFSYPRRADNHYSWESFVHWVRRVRNDFEGLIPEVEVNHRARLKARKRPEKQDKAA
jgi:hypothetical protein